MATMSTEIPTSVRDHPGAEQTDFSQIPTAIAYTHYSSLSSPDHIRLLRILPGNDERIAVSLEESAIDAISYDCLSYTWDGPRYNDTADEVSPPTELVIVAGKRV